LAIRSSNRSVLGSSTRRDYRAYSSRFPAIRADAAATSRDCRLHPPTANPAT
jgi:hypothetical protein